MNSVATLTELTLAQRGELLKMARARDLVGDRSELPPIERAPRDERLPLSFAQQGLWFVEQLGDLGATYHMPVRLRLRGELHRDALVRALDGIVARHEALRTTFAQVDGIPEQRIAPAEASRFHLLQHDLRGRTDAEAELDRLMAGEARAPFDLEEGPLIRGRLIHLAEADHVLLLTMHHMVGDGWSMGVLNRELGALYGAFRRGEPDPLPAPAVQYADYAAWQRRLVGGGALREQADYWTQALAGAPELLELPADRPRPAQMDHAGASLRVELDEELTAGLKALSRRHGTTLFMTLLAGWATVLSRLSGQDDVVIGTPTANRGRREIEGLIGFIAGTLPLRVDLSGAPTVAELLGRVKKRALEAQRNQDIPFEQVVERVDPVRSMAYSPLFQAMFTWQNAQRERLELAGLQVISEPVASAGRSKVDLSLALGEREGRITGGVSYATALFERETVERWMGYLRRVLEEMVADGSRRVERLALMPESERTRVLEEWNHTDAAYPDESCIHERFEAQAARTPDSTAVVSATGSLTYAELNARANRLAHHLRALGVGPDVRVGLCVERSPAMVVGVLGVLKAGGVFVPLDPGYPVERLEYMLADSAPAAVLAQKDVLDRFQNTGVPVLELDAAAPAWADQPVANPERGGLTPGHPAYVTYTSGSTGRPKGVPSVHHKVLNLVHWYGRELGITERDAVLLVMSFSFDGTYRNLFAPLFAGGQLHLAGDPFDPPAIVAQIAAHGISTVNLTPTAFQSLVEADRDGALARMRTVVLVGEAVQPRKLMELPEPRPALVNLYGPTECSGIVTYHRLDAELTRYLERPVPAGRPIPNGRIYILDRSGSPVPVGVAGELYIGGTPVGNGYQNRPGLTAERFVADPFGGEPGARLYRTGDRARWLADGTIEFLGRMDFQVKVRGYRIEPGEVEARLAAHPAVREAVVLVREDPRGEARLVAYWLGEAVEPEALRAHLGGALPPYMVPSAYVRMEQWPLTPNGKLDRRALPAPDGEAYAARAFEEPVGATEQALAEIWADVLRVERVGRRDSFFELGGHSLRAVQVISRVRQVLQVDVALGELFTRPVLRDFARGLDTAARAELPPIQPADRQGHVPLSFAQQRLWFLEQLGDLGGAYHIRTGVRLRGALDRAALARALDTIVARHEALRTVFAQVDGVPEQRIAPADIGFLLREHDLARRADAEAELGRLVDQETHAVFDLQRGPLIRGRLVRLAADDHVLLLTMHHIVSDAWSMGVLIRELSALYAAHREGREADLASLPVQYADYAAWQRRWVEGEVLREQAEYWTRTLVGAPELLELPTDRPRPAEQDHAGARLRVELDEELTAGLKALSRRHGTTLFMTLLAGWATVLGRLSGQDDVVIGTPTANRGRREIEGLIGFFVNTLALRVDLSGAPTVAELLARVKERALEAQHHQDIPFEQVVEVVQPARSLAHSPLFQVLFAWQNAPRALLELPGLALNAVGAAAGVTAKFDLSLNLHEADGRVLGGVEYATSLFDGETIERYLGYLRAVLVAMVADERQAVAHLPLLPETERRRVVVDWNATDAAFPRDVPVHALFAAQAARAPQAVALVDGGASLTYAELNARANALAHHLRARDVEAGSFVAILIPRSADLVVAELAVLKAGAAYVPIDPAFPAERIALMVADCGARLVLARAGDALPALPAERVDVDVLAESATHDLPTAMDGEAAAYVMYTSGSTGTPKGVVVPHRAIARLVINNGYAHFRPEDRVAFAANPAFDASTLEIWAPLLNGGRTVVISDDVLLEPARFVEALTGHGVNVLWMTVGLFNQYADALATVLPRLRYLIVGGDALDPHIIARVLARGAPEHLLNGYGPTETTTFALTHEIDRVADGARSIPLGRPIGNTRVYILDAQGQPVPVGVAGEMYIGGAGVALGYLHQPALTEERFIPDPFSGDAGARLYRTGDLGRWLPDGTVQFLGRNDSQVKIRGYRIELGEIEARLAGHPEVREAVVVAREDTPGEKRLVAYVVGAETAGADVLRAHLGQALPAYMVPAAFVRLDALPLTPNGKIDRRALPAPEGDAFAARAYRAPVGATEQALAEIWAQVLRVDRVGRGDDFFELGGHSLLAVQVISRVRQVLGVEVALGELFARPVLSDFARELETAVRAELPPIEPADRDGRVPLSFAQQRLWFLEQLGAVGSAYHIHAPLRLRGALDRAALARALDEVVARHEALRTTFAQVDCVPEQRIAPAEGSGFALARHDLAGHADAEAELDRLMAEEARAPFDLRRGPLIRGRLVRLGDDDHVLLLTMHHIVSDGWSMGVLFGELSALYAAHREGRDAYLATLPVQYADYAAWQRRWVEGGILREQAEYWTRTLGGAPELLALPTDHPRPAQTDYAGALLVLELDPELTAGLKALGRRHGTTLFMTLLAGWAAVLGRLSGQEDVVIGTPTAGRGRREIEGLIGFFVNTLAVRVDLAGTPTVAELLGRVRERTLGAQHHQDIPFEQVVERVAPARTLSHSPLFQVMFAWQEMTRDGGLALPALEVGRVGRASLDVQAKFDLSLTLREAGGRIAGSITYAASLFERETVERWAGYLRRVLREMVADESRRVERLALLSGDERAQVLDGWNGTDAPYPDDACLHELIERQVERTPDATALVFEGEPLTYAELNRRANRLAHHLGALGVGPDVRVGLCVERSLEMMVGLLAVLKAGGAYVPLDPGYPADRLAYMLADSAPALVLAQARLRDRVEHAGVPVLELDADVPAWAHQPATSPGRGALTPDHLAYVIYTSGSTGRPKGVEVPHRGVVNRLAWMPAFHGLDARDVVLQKTPYSFDVSVWELFWPLAAGARLVIARPDGHRDPAYLSELIRRERVTTVHFVPSLLGVFLEHPECARGTALRRVVTSGEALPPELVARFGERLPGVELHNLYGPTEAAVDVTAWKCATDGSETRVPIGRPVANTRVYLLDPAGEPVPVGVAGELYIGGVQVARGYGRRPDLTADRFVADPFGGAPGARLYRTGDLARWRPDGSIEYLGRMDHQVKVRGFRVELGEIEARLQEHAAVHQCVVLARQDAPGQTRLVAYVVGGEAAGAEVLRAHLGQTLPEHMVPAAYVRLDALPLTPSGKLDRRALPAPEGDAYAARAYEAPVGHTEQALAEIWSEVLRIERVGRHDDFFELGGHSLLAVQVISRVRQVLAVEAELGQVFTRPVLQDFARGLETAARSELPPIDPASRGDRLPLSFAQQRLWFLEQLGNLGSTYHVPRRLRLRGSLDRDALVRALDGIVARHEALRTTFALLDGAPEQRIAPADIGFHLVEHGLRGAADAEAELGRLMAGEAGAPFDLERGPLIRGRLIRLAADDHVLLLTMHHIVSDAWSTGVFTRELSALYGAFLRGEPDPLPPLPVQYADYAAWQRRWVEGEVLQAQADYWTGTLSGAPELLELPTDHPRPARQDFAGATAGLVLGEALTAGLKALSQRHGTTLFMTVLAGWATVLSRLSGQEDVVVGTPSANRGRREIEGLIGFFVNTLALRVDFSSAPTVAEVLAQVKARALEAQQNQDIPFEQVVELVQPARSLAHTPLFQVMFAWQNAPREGLALPGLEPAPAGAASQVTAKFDLMLSLGEAGGRITGGMEYATALFEKETVERWLGYLRRVLEAMAADDALGVDRLPMVPEAERRLVLREFNDTRREYPREACVHELVEAQVERTPGTVAVVSEGERVTYAELNARANRLAHHLRGLGVAPDARVGICVERSVEMVVGLLGILKAGGAYVPLDSSYPVDRLRNMLEDSAPAVLLTHPPLAATVAALSAGSAVPVLDLADAAAWAHRSDTNPGREGLGPRNLAHVLFTSGSTGRPKGVMLEHGSLVNLLAWMQDRYAMEPHEALLQKTPFSFDVSFWEFFWPLMVGARLVMARPGGHRDPAYLVEVIRREGVTVAHFVPSMLQVFLEHPDAGACSGLLRVPVSGEAVSAALVRQFHERLPGVGLYNQYGPTESGEVTEWECDPGAERVSIGRAIHNSAVYVLDRAGEPVPVGVAGELFIAGVAVARGYLGRPRLTAERFVPDPFGEPGARMYRTGDLCRWLPDGTLEYLGRTDFQVKVRGFRVEPGEIEARLASHPGVREAVVLALDDGSGGKRLAAYFVGEALESEALRAHLSAHLPEYMVPAAFVRLEAFPVTPNGKLDRRALPAPADEAYARRGYEAPVGETEQALAEIWSAVLGVERVGRQDNFFELGGHSLLAVQVISRVRQVLEVEVELRTVFERPRLSQLAQHVVAAQLAQFDPVQIARLTELVSASAGDAFPWP
ncbi:MAG TPA: non-ribosomal peptide synthase/polyketide synthase [Longimicrobium sp.]|nr:non-ribosomal peptide synthase/polyketide synthase [Longimicrobium sp.]